MEKPALTGSTASRSRSFTAALRGWAGPAEVRRRLGRVSCTGHASSGAASLQWNVYCGRMPLIGLEPLVSALERTPAVPAAELLQLHTYLLLEGPSGRGVWYTDFLPLNPTSPATGLMLLTGGTAPGHVRFKCLPAQRVKQTNHVRLLGVCTHADPLAAVHAYNRAFNKDLHLLLNNCAHHTFGLKDLLL